MGLIWVDNNRADMNSGGILNQLNNERGPLTQEAYGSTSERIQLGYNFSFLPLKTMIILLNFTPSKLHSDLKAPQQSSGSVICILGFVGTRLKLFGSNAALKKNTTLRLHTKRK